MDTGLAFACFGIIHLRCMSILPIALNQFAVDKAGLTLALLSPLSDRDYLAGKATGNALMVALPAFSVSLAAFLVLPGTRIRASWAAIPVSLSSPYLPGRARGRRVLGALPPRRGPEQHRPRQQRPRARRLLGMLTFVVAAALTAGSRGARGILAAQPRDDPFDTHRRGVRSRSESVVSCSYRPGGFSQVAARIWRCSSAQLSTFSQLSAFSPKPRAMNWTGVRASCGLCADSMCPEPRRQLIADS